MVRMRTLHRRPARHRLAPAAVVPLLIFGVTACGPDDDGKAGSSEESTSASVDSSGDGGTSSSVAPVGEEVDAKEFAKEIESAFKGIDTAHITMELVNAGLVMTATGQVDYTGEKPRMSMEMSAPAFGEQSIQARVVDDGMYLAMPMLGAGTEDVFYKIDLDDPNNPMAASLGGLSSFDPKSTVEMFGQGLEKVTLVGEDSVDGAHTRHYVLTTNTEAFKKTLGDQAGKVPDTLDYDVWLDDEGRLAKMTAELDAQGSMELKMSKWGEPVKIVAPPASKVQPYPTGAAKP
ncbi:hypothetical protein ASD66_12970 [Nocardioides sp. Root151]|nr:hypothetical protein ASD66_12970 [Nocardioides sp. Root151]